MNWWTIAFYVTVFILVEVCAENPESCRKGKTESRIFFENNGTQKCYWERKFPRFQKGYLRIEMETFDLANGNAPTINGKRYATQQCLYITLPNSSCVLPNTQCDVIQKNNDSKIILTSEIKGDKFTIKFSEEDCSLQNSENTSTTIRTSIDIFTTLRMASREFGNATMTPSTQSERKLIKLLTSSAQTAKDSVTSQPIVFHTLIIIIAVPVTVIVFIACLTTSLVIRNRRRKPKCTSTLTMLPGNTAVASVYLTREECLNQCQRQESDNQPESFYLDMASVQAEGYYEEPLPHIITQPSGPGNNDSSKNISEEIVSCRSIDSCFKQSELQQQSIYVDMNQNNEITEQKYVNSPSSSNQIPVCAEEEYECLDQMTTKPE